MKTTGEGRQIITNMEEDPNVPEAIWLRFLQNIARASQDETDELLSLSKAITSELLLRGPRVLPKALSRFFSRLMRVRDLMRYLDDSIPVYQDEEGRRIIYEWVMADDFEIDELLNSGQLRGLQPMLWATLHREVENHFNLGLDTDALCDKLGLRIDKHEHMVEIRYSAEEATEIKRPTVIEGGGNPLFLPSDAEEEIGFTRDLRTFEAGLPEVVHKPVSTSVIEELIPRGMKVRDADIESDVDTSSWPKSSPNEI